MKKRLTRSANKAYKRRTTSALEDFHLIEKLVRVFNSGVAHFLGTSVGFDEANVER